MSERERERERVKLSVTTKTTDIRNTNLFLAFSIINDTSYKGNRTCSYAKVYVSAKGNFNVSSICQIATEFSSNVSSRNVAFLKGKLFFGVTGLTMRRIYECAKTKGELIRRRAAGSRAWN